MICRLCGQDKVAGDFVWKTNGKVARGQKCRACLKETIYDTPEYKDSQRDANYRRLYGITLEQYNALWEKQGGKCAICGEVPKATGKNSILHVDHDHRTQQVRGLICYACNIGIGFIGEDASRIYRILDYLNFGILKE